MSDVPKQESKPERALRIFGHVLDALIAIVFVSVIFNTLNSWMIYKAGLSLLDKHFEIMFYLLVVRSLTIVPWRRFAAARPAVKAGSVVVFAVYLLFLQNLIRLNFYSAVEAIVITRGAFQGATDLEIAADITEYNKWYPRMSFVQRFEADVPEDARIAYIGDQRPHIMSYLLYPRRLYALPQMQEVLNQAIQDNWTWSDWEDPSHPQEDPLNPRFQGDYARMQNKPDEKLQAEFLAMVREKNIGWVMYYDALFPDKSWYRKIESE